jgi:hypothetical protein
LTHVKPASSVSHDNSKKSEDPHAPTDDKTPQPLSSSSGAGSNGHNNLLAGVDMDMFDMKGKEEEEDQGKKATNLLIERFHFY